MQFKAIFATLAFAAVVAAVPQRPTILQEGERCVPNAVSTPCAKGLHCCGISAQIQYCLPLNVVC
ncbi:hypothetical protein BJ165DRAFT_1500633 [Panaeolus papilionaceus]|nr:hypothetical protein BJ165DRAFT_1500633 [Panaeolus papilionaceus]